MLSPLNEYERTQWDILKEAAAAEMGACLIRGELDGRERAFIAAVSGHGTEELRTYPMAMLLTEEETERVLGPAGEPTEE